jgi:radical SAM superfamily enzyme YgiQ (UPF0313 family)
MSDVGQRVSHRPGVLIIEQEAISIADLDTGEARPMLAAEWRSPWSAPELRRTGGPVAESVPAIAPRDGDPVALRQPLVVHEPSLLRLDDGRVLAWDLVQRSHVELSGGHLELLDRLRTPMTASEAAAEPDDLARLSQLLGLSLVVAPSDEAGAHTELAAAEPTLEEEAAPDDDDDGMVAVETPSVSLASSVRSALSDLPKSKPSAVKVVAFRLVTLARRRIAARRGALRPKADRSTPSAAPVAPESEALTHTVESEAPQPAADDHAGVAASSPHGQEVVSPVVTDPPDPVVSARDPRVPVIPLYCWGTVSDDQGYGEMVEPSLSVGVLFATARHHDGGSLNEIYDLRRIQPDSFAVLEAWEQNPVPAIFVFSDYLWNVDIHLELSERVKAASPLSVCLHGGPSVPKYEEDSRRFFEENPSVDVCAHGEGERTFVEILERLAGDLSDRCLDRLAITAGITYRRAIEPLELVRTGDRERIADLDEIPSPYLSGEFDDLVGVEWRSASIETNRGCPYGCTYCDWGSATLSRIRKFDLDRVKAELDWIVERAAPSELHITDANCGIFARDVEVAQHVADLRRRFGTPYALTLSLAKNTVKYSQKIIEILVAADVAPITASAAVQTMDPDTLVAIDRKNIKLQKYDELAVTFTEQGIPLVTDLLMGLPGSTLESFKNDLQHCFDREVTPRTMEIIMLPNSPMNEPSYRERYALQVDENDVIVESSTFTRDDYSRMQQLRLLFRAADHFGILRLLLRHLQWEHGLRALDVLADLNDVVDSRGDRYPLLAFVARSFDVYTAPPVGWEPFYDEVAQFLQERYGLELSSDLADLLALQRALMPAHGRVFPEQVELLHDVEAYFADRRAERNELVIRRPLRRYPPAAITVRDPGDICERNIKRNAFPGRRSATTGNLFWVGYDWELDSPFVRHLATNVGRFEGVVA